MSELGKKEEKPKTIEGRLEVIKKWNIVLSIALICMLIFVFMSWKKNNDLLNAVFTNQTATSKASKDMLELVKNSGRQVAVVPASDTYKGLQALVGKGIITSEEAEVHWKTVVEFIRNRKDVVILDRSNVLNDAIELKLPDFPNLEERLKKSQK